MFVAESLLEAAGFGEHSGDVGSEMTLMIRQEPDARLGEVLIGSVTRPLTTNSKLTK